jgi:SulP family sulfate permease
MDTTGLVALEDIYHDLNRRGCRLILSGLQPEVERLLERSGLLGHIGLDNCFKTTDAAIRSLTNHTSLADSVPNELATLET